MRGPVGKEKEKERGGWERRNQKRGNKREEKGKKEERKRKK